MPTKDNNKNINIDDIRPYAPEGGDGSGDNENDSTDTGVDINNTDPQSKIKKDLITRTQSYTKKDTPNSWIVIHNTAGGASAKNVRDLFQKGGANNSNTSTHYAIGDDGIVQILEDTWSGKHTGTPPSSSAGAWYRNYQKSTKAGDRGCKNANSIGIEICDGGDAESFIKRCKNAIELTRYLMKKYNIPIDHVVRHVDCSGKPCPGYMIGPNFEEAQEVKFSWEDFIGTISARNQANDPIMIDGDFTTGGNGDTATGPAPEFDNREDWTNLQEVRGVVLNYVMPYHRFSMARHKKQWDIMKYEKEFHYGVDSSGMKAFKDNNLIAFSMQDNNRATYINRALFHNKAEKYCISVDLFTSEALTNYQVTEKQLIRTTARILHKFRLTPNDLWREFDLNRAPSPIIYLDNNKWKEFLKEVSKQYDWLVENHPLPEDDYNKNPEDNVDKEGKSRGSYNVYKEAKISSDVVDTLKLGQVVKTKSYKDGWFELESPAGYIQKEKLDFTPTDTFAFVCPTPRSPEDEEDVEYVDSELRDPDFVEVDESEMPEITNILTHEEFLELLAYADPKLVDIYSAKHEPYDKNLPEIINADVTDDERLQSLINKIDTMNENTINYAIVEASPGDGDHCKRASSELSSITRPDPISVEPIYPDLIIPPNYSTADQNLCDPNALPPGALAGVGTIQDYLDKDNSNSDTNEELYKISMFDYSKAKLSKESVGKPINYADPYPYDDKIYELEKHSPKVKIDEIESRLYDCNHIGCPIGQPMAKNFHMLNDAMLTQSKKTEKRLVKLENTLAFVMRNLGRLGSRVHINCVYYGGQDNFGKYKTIRCLDDMRFEDGCSVTIDQCLACTRYEPILGQIYDILDETGINGSYITDDNQMSYGNAINFNKLDNVSVEEYANLKEDKDNTEYESLIDRWKKADFEQFKKELAKKYSGDELEKKIKEAKEHEYLFKMDWSENTLEMQEPDVKRYPTEGIKAKYKVKEQADAGEETSESNPSSVNSRTILPTEEEMKRDEENDKKLQAGEWVDTREEADTYEINKYSSEDFFFEGFGTNLGTSYGGSGSSIPGMGGTEVRNKIVEMAKIIVQECADGKAWYEMESPRTTKHPNDGGQYAIRNTSGKSNQIIYDCSSFVSCCWHHAGLKALTEKTNYPQLQETIKNGETWLPNEEGRKKLMPGDLIWTAEHTVTDPKSISKSKHIMVYIGDNKIAHAANPSKGIVIADADYLWKDGRTVCGRPQELIEADKAANNGSTGGMEYVSGVTSKGGTNYSTVWKFPKAVITSYYDLGHYASETNGATVQARQSGQNCAAHNMPFGTKIYIPDLDGVAVGNNTTGVFTVKDTGGHLFDFDIHTPNIDLGKTNKDVYVLEWGNTKRIASSFIGIITDDAYAKKYQEGWRLYRDMKGQTIKFWKFKDEDKAANLNANVDPRPGKE